MTKFSVMATGALPMSDYVPLARKVEAYGFSQMHIADDLVFRPAWPILTLIAANTSTIELGPFIVTPAVANPAYHAANLAALDELSGGRMVCGVGRGGFNPLLGITPDRPLTVLKEAWHLMDRMLAGDRTPFEGDFFHATSDLYFQFDVPRRIPLFIGTWSPQTARLAGTFAPGIKIDCCADPTRIAQLRAEFLTGRQKACRTDDEDVEIMVGPLASIHQDRSVARDHARGLLALLQPFLAPMTAAAGITDEEITAASDAFNRGDVEEAKALVTDTAIDAFTLSGTPDDVIGRIEDLVQAGADHVVFGPPIGPDPMGALDLLGAKVLPHFGVTRRSEQ